MRLGVGNKRRAAADNRKKWTDRQLIRAAAPESSGVVPAVTSVLLSVAGRTIARVPAASRNQIKNVLKEISSQQISFPSLPPPLPLWPLLPLLLFTVLLFIKKRYVPCFNLPTNSFPSLSPYTLHKLSLHPLLSQSVCCPLLRQKSFLVELSCYKEVVGRLLVTNVED